MNLLNSGAGNPPTVLLVEDLQDDVFFFKLALERAKVSANVHLASDGMEAVDYFSNRGKFADAALYPRPDLVFRDLKMPNMNGFEVLQWLLDHPLKHAPRVIVLTGSEEPADRVRVKQLGAYAYHVKPPRRETLLELFGTLSSRPQSVENGFQVLVPRPHKKFFVPGQRPPTKRERSCGLN